MVRKPLLVTTAILGGAFAASAIGLTFFGASAWLVTGRLPHIMPLVFLLPYVFIVTSAIAATVGLAWHNRAVRRNRKSAFWYWLPGGVTGFILGSVLVGALSLIARETMADWPFVLALFVLVGALSGLFAWLIRRPDRDPPNPATQTP